LPSTITVADLAKKLRRRDSWRSDVDGRMKMLSTIENEIRMRRRDDPRIGFELRHDAKTPTLVLWRIGGAGNGRKSK
jgi:hypothetical protein